jgi:hypothetical protein
MRHPGMPLAGATMIVGLLMLLFCPAGLPKKQK